MPSGEDQLIARYFAPLVSAEGALGLRDDAAHYAPPAGHELVLTTDAIVSGVHFLEDDPPDTVARKALRVNLSDLAAKGAAPAGCLMTLALPDRTPEAWLADFAAGLKVDCDGFACSLFGGDTVRTDGPISVCIFAFGILPLGTMVKRSGAKAGDRVFVSGSIGDGALGLKLSREPALAKNWLLDNAGFEHLIGRYRVPQPRVILASAVRAHASSAMDVSDGLVGDLAKLCDVSGVSARIDAARVPISHDRMRSDPSLLETILTGGDDYEILCTVSPDRADEFASLAKSVDIAVTDIGEIVAGNGAPRVIGADGSPLTFSRTSFSHF